MPSDLDIARVRSFNRLVTRQAGVVNDRYLGRRPLGESRVLFESGLEGRRRATCARGSGSTRATCRA